MVMVTIGAILATASCWAMSLKPYNGLAGSMVPAESTG